jgi:hypothetical protein
MFYLAYVREQKRSSLPSAPEEVEGWLILLPFGIFGPFGLRPFRLPSPPLWGGEEGGRLRRQKRSGLRERRGTGKGCGPYPYPDRGAERLLLRGWGCKRLAFPKRPDFTLLVSACSKPPKGVNPQLANPDRSGVTAQQPLS